MKNLSINASRILDEFKRQESHPIKASTIDSYLNHVDSMRNYSIAKRTLDWETPEIVSLAATIDDLLNRTDLSNGTKRTYRAALLWYTSENQNLSSEDHRALKRLEESALPKGRRTESSKPRVISDEDFKKLQDELESSRSKWANRTLAWIRAALATGLRPKEWLNAKWVDEDQTLLKVANGKAHLSEPAFMRNKQKSASQAIPGDDTGIYLECDPGEIFDSNTYREIPISYSFDRLDINSHLDKLNEYVDIDLPQKLLDQAFHNYFEQCRQVMSRACKKIWKGKKSYSLYTLRKQYSANMKAIHGSDITAKLMGHSSKDSPSTAHYGKANQAHQMFKSLKQTQTQIEINKPVERRYPGESSTE